MHTSIRIDVPESPAALYSKHSGASGRAGLPHCPGRSARSTPPPLLRHRAR